MRTREDNGSDEEDVRMREDSERTRMGSEDTGEKKGRMPVPLCRLERASNSSTAPSLPSMSISPRHDEQKGRIEVLSVIGR